MRIIAHASCSPLNLRTKAPSSPIRLNAILPILLWLGDRLHTCRSRRQRQSFRYCHS